MTPSHQKRMLSTTIADSKKPVLLALLLRGGGPDVLVPNPSHRGPVSVDAILDHARIAASMESKKC